MGDTMDSRLFRRRRRRRLCRRRLRRRRLRRLRRRRRDFLWSLSKPEFSADLFQIAFTYVLG